MPVRDLGNGRKLTIKLIRMATHSHARTMVEDIPEACKFSYGVLEALIDFETHHYWKVADSGASCEWVVGIPKIKLDGSPAETTYQLIHDYVRYLDPEHPSKPYNVWMNTRWARVWRVEGHNVTGCATAPQPDADRVFVEVGDNGDHVVMFAVAMQKKFK